MAFIDDVINGARQLLSDTAQGIRLFFGIHELLLSPAVQKIRFSAEAVTISGRNYTRLASKMREGKLHFVISNRDWDGTAWNGPITTAAANYWYAIDTVQLLPGFTLASFEDKGILLHELTHAAIDDMNLPASRGLHETENEGIAYIVEMLYRRYTHSLTSGAFGLPQLRVANAIAKNIAASSSLYTVSQDEIRLLRNTIGHRPIYRSIRGHLRVGNGIGGA